MLIRTLAFEVELNVDIALEIDEYNSHSQLSGLLGVITVEHMIQLHIERLPEGGYLATSGEVQGLVAQGRTIQETLEIARDVAKKLIEAQSDSNATSSPPSPDP